MATRFLLATVCLLCFLSLSAQQGPPVTVSIDATDAERRVLHIAELLPAHQGENVFCYAQWVPGRERADGPIDNLTGLFFHAAGSVGASVSWRRDLSDPYCFHVPVPAGTSAIAASYDILDTPSHFHSSQRRHTSSHVAMIELSDVVLYPANTPLDTMPVTASVHLPAHWTAASALRTGKVSSPSLQGPDVTYATVSMEQLIDSPILAGDHCRSYALAPGIRPMHTLEVCSDSEAGSDLQPAFLAKMTMLVEQAMKLFGGHPYEHYDFLVAASPHLTGDSTEHTQSADYILSSLDTSNAATAESLGTVLPHEYVHAWCGKYRRPAGMVQANLNLPMQNDLIWVYEGFTQYYGNVLNARAGLRTPAQMLDLLDFEAFQVDRPGRAWRSIQDTSDASAILRSNDRAWDNWRLGQDYYYAGTLLWLEADVKIRELTRGRKSLDDFAATFFAPPLAGSNSRDAGPGIIPYSLTDVMQALNAVAPYDWNSFWAIRLNARDFRSLTGGLQGAGYDYVYQSNMNPGEAVYVEAAHIAELYHSLGFESTSDGTLEDVWVGSPAFLVGLGPGDKLTTVNDKPYSPELLIAAIHDALTSSGPLVLTAMRDDESHTFKIEYKGGEKYSGLVRNAKPDLLTTSILQPK